MLNGELPLERQPSLHFCQTFMTSFRFWSMVQMSASRFQFEESLWRCTPPPTFEKKKRYPTVAASSPVLSDVLYYFRSTYINCMCLVLLSEGSKISMYADDILLCKPVYYLDNSSDGWRDIDAIHECINTCH